MNEIPIYKKHVICAQALIDDDDYERVNQYRWRLHKRGYVYSIIKQDGKNKFLLLHRFIMSAPKGMDVDHINHNKLDNQKSNNLRICTHSQNAANRIKRGHHKGKPCSSRFKGVSWDKINKKWVAQIRKDNRQIYLGLYISELDAASAYNIAALEQFGKFSLLNQI